jgi:sugar phosphate isomerase/epimerase
MSIMDATHAELANIAAGLNCSHVCFFIKGPGPDGMPPSSPRIDSIEAAREFRRRLDGSGLTPGTVELFLCRPDQNIDDYEQMLESASLLGARRITAMNFHPVPAAAVDQMGAFCELAAKYGLTVGLEWYRYCRTKTLEAALELVRAVRQPNLALRVDILHLTRNGGNPRDLMGVDPALMDLAQINDGPLEQPEERQADEAAANRGIPGEGEFPLVSFVQHLPESAVLAVEAPTDRLRGSLTPAQRASRAVAGTRRILAAAGR